MTLHPRQFLPHGTTRVERRGRVLLMYSEGPFNAEHVASLAPAFREHALELAPGGHWLTINVVHSSIMATPDALATLARSAVDTRALGRIGIGYVVSPEVEGYRLMQTLILAATEPVLPTRFFTTLEPALAWAEELLAEARGSQR